MAMMLSLHRRLDKNCDGQEERQFFSNSLQYLATSSGRVVQLEDWMVTSYEVEFGHVIGSGGL